jgi:glycosyltransferase involved in cell wall biosynthesis
MGKKAVNPSTKRILFLIPSADVIPSGKVRVLNYLPYLRDHSMIPTVLSHNLPFVLKFERERPTGSFPLIVLRICRKLLRLTNILYRKWIEVWILLFVSGYDVLLIQWEPVSRYVVQRILKRNPNLIYDYDDPVFLMSKENVDFLISNSKTVIAGSPQLRDYSKSLNEHVVIIPSSIPIEKYDAVRNEDRSHHDSGPVIGWIGSQSTSNHIELLIDVFEALGKEYEMCLKIIGLGGTKCPIPESAFLRIRTVDYYNESEMIRHALSLDVGVVPFKETEASRWKTSLKALVYMAAAVPVVCSPIGGNLEVVEDGRNGFFASTTQKWIEKLELLIQDKSLRERMGKNGLNLVRERYTTQVCFKSLRRVLESACHGEPEPIIR